MWEYVTDLILLFFFKNIKNNIKNESSPNIFLLASKIYTMEGPILSQHTHPQNYIVLCFLP